MPATLVNLAIVIVVLMFLILFGVYYRRHGLHSNVNDKLAVSNINPQIAENENENDSKNNDIPQNVDDSESEPELQAQIAEKEEKESENENKNEINDSNNELSSSDSEQYSMAKMVEEYNKTQTISNKLKGIMTDISDTFQQKTIEIKQKFAKQKKNKNVIIPMTFKTESESDKKDNEIIEKNNNENMDFEVKFDENNENMNEKQEIIQNENMNGDKIEENVDFGDFDHNFKHFDSDSDTEIKLIDEKEKENDEIESGKECVNEKSDKEYAVENESGVSEQNESDNVSLNE